MLLICNRAFFSVQEKRVQHMKLDFYVISVVSMVGGNHKNNIGNL